MTLVVPITYNVVELEISLWSELRADKHNTAVCFRKHPIDI